MPRTFYIYTHASPEYGVFYVGKGSGSRASDMKNRNEYHKRIVGKSSSVAVKKFNCHDERHAFFAEIEMILRMRKAGFQLCNITAGGEGPVGFKHSSESRKKMSESKKGLVPHNKGGTSWGKGKKYSESHRAAISSALKGRCVSPLGLQRAHEASRGSTPHNKGKKLSPEHIEKLRAAKIGKKLTDEHKAAIGAACRDSEKHRLSVQNRKHTNETKMKISVALKAFQERRK